MLLVLDVGNTNTVLGVFGEDAPVDHDATEAQRGSSRYSRLLANWRVTTRQSSTVDEYGVLFRNLFSMANLEAREIQGIVISSVVPPLDPVLRQVCERYFNSKPLFIEPGIKTGMPVQYENPAEVGADRIVNGVAAFEKYGGPCVIVDFGTATTFDCVSAKGEYLGGVICPGIGISADAVRRLYGDKAPEADDNLLGWIPNLDRQLRSAGQFDDIEVPTKLFISKIDPEVYKTLHDDIRSRPGAMTIEETKAPEAKPAEEQPPTEPPPTPGEGVDPVVQTLRKVGGLDEPLASYLKAKDLEEGGPGIRYDFKEPQDIPERGIKSL